MLIPLSYEIPLFIFIALALYTIHKLWVAQRLLSGGSLREPYRWFIAATVFFLLWGLNHVYNDVVPLPAATQVFLHYVVSHGMLVVSMLCIAVAAGKTERIYIGMLDPHGKKKGKTGQ